MKQALQHQPLPTFPILVVTLGMLLLGGGCDGLFNQRPSPLESVKVGLLVPETSENLRNIALSWQKAAVLAQEQINSAGGLYDGRRLELIIADTAADPDVAANAMRSVLNENVVGVVGPATSGSSLATRDLAAQAEVPQISCCATSTEITAAQSDREGWFFRTTAHDLFQAGALAYLGSQGTRGPHPAYQAATGATSGAIIDSCSDMIIIQQDDPYGSSLSDSLETAFTGRPISYWNANNELVARNGPGDVRVLGNIVSRLKYEIDFVGSRSPADGAVIAQAQSYLRGEAAGYESNDNLIEQLALEYDYSINAGVCVVIIAFPADGGAMIRAISGLLDAAEAERRVIDPTFALPRTYLATDGLANDDFAGAAGALVLQVKGTTPSHAYNNAYTEFRTAYKARFTEEPPPFTSQIFDAVILMALAVTKAGVDDGPLVRDALFEVSRGGTPQQGVFFGEMASAILDGQDIDYIGPSGSLDFDDKGDVQSDYALWQGAQVEGSEPPLYTAVLVDQLPFAEFNP